MESLCDWRGQACARQLPCCVWHRQGWVHKPFLVCHCIESCVLLQVTKGTVDEGIYAMAERKLRLDAAVLDGVTAAGDGKSSGATVETAQVLLAPATCSLACSSPSC